MREVKQGVIIVSFPRNLAHKLPLNEFPNPRPSTGRKGDKNEKHQFSLSLSLCRALFLLIAMFLIGLSPTYAQIGELGIYGTVPSANASNIHYVYLQDLSPPFEGADDHFLPVNGLKNFNFFYSSDGTGFVPSGIYRVHYYGADKTTHYGYDQVTYSPNSDHTDGEEVRPFNIPDPEPKLPLGVHGTIMGYDENNNIVPLVGLKVKVYRAFAEGFAVTNGDGYFSVYYGNLSGFLEASPHPFVFINQQIGECHYSLIDLSGDLIYRPWTGNDSGYFVAGASAHFEPEILECE